MNTTRQGLLEAPVPPVQQPHYSQVAKQFLDAGFDRGVIPVPPVQQPQYSQVSVEDLARQMLAAGYDPSTNRAQAIANMQKVNIPQSVINHALEIADRQAAESKKAATTAAPVTTVPPSGQAMQRMNQGRQHKQPAFQ